MFKLLLLFVLLWSLLGQVRAHGSPYFEFNPDAFTTTPFTVVGSGTVYQLFVPQNDFVGGFDLWASNANTSGTATFTLQTLGGTTLAARTVTIPALADITGGTRLHVDFLSQVAVTGSSVYRILIATSEPNLKFYYSSRIKPIQYNAPPALYQNGAVQIGTEEKEFSFKFALYEYSESTAPVLSNISTTNLSASETRMDFNSTEPVDYRIEYGPQGQGYTQSTQFSGTYASCTSGISICSVTVAVSPNMTYEYRLTAKDVWGNTVSSTGTFVSVGLPTPTPTPTPTPATTPTPTPAGPTPTPTPTPAPDTTAPVISNLRIAELTHNSITVAWTTDEAANSYLLVSYPALITVDDDSDGELELEHLLMVSGLNPDNQYVYKVTSADASGNSTSSDTSGIFQTLQAPAPPPPDTSPPPPPVQSPTPTPTPGVGAVTGTGSDTTVSWTPGGEEPSGGYRIDVFDESNNLIRTLNVPAGTYRTTISGLPENARIVVYASESGTFRKLGSAKTQKSLLDRFYENWPYVLGGLVAAAGILAFVAWRQRKAKALVPPAPIA